MSGGLGNQLFQASAARKLVAKGEIVLLPNLGQAIKGVDGEVEISDFNIENFEVRIDQKNFSRLQIFSARQILKMSSVDSKSFLKSSIANILKVLYQSLLGTLIGERIQSPRGIGFDSSFKLNPSTTLLIGNFHSYLWVGDDFKERLKLRKSKTDIFKELESETKRNNSIGVHVRLGDYLSIDELNVLNYHYYSIALENFANRGDNNATLIFTNEPTRLGQYLPTEFISSSRIVDLNLSSSETLELLRNCSTVLMANSTFSWWGAYSNHHIQPRILMPERWFRTRLNPIQMAPASWIRVPNE